MVDPQPDNPAPDAWRSNTRAFLVREWPYLLVLILAIFGVAYTSFSKTPITTYWIVLAPFIGLICVITRWRDAENREQRLRLIWTQALLDAGAALGRGTCGNASHVCGRCQPDDERRCQRSSGIDGARTRDLYGWRSHRSMAHLRGRHRAGAWGPGHRMARAINAAPSVDCGCRRGGHCTIFLASQTVGSTSSRIMRDCCTAGYRRGL